MKWIITLVCAGVAVSGCGQKGPLYLPDKNASVVTRPAPTATAPAPATPDNTSPGTPKPQDGKDDSQSSNQAPRN